MLDRCEFDYVKFIFTVFPDEGQRLWMVFRQQLTNGEVDLMRQVRLTALGEVPDSSGKRRYILEAWGEASSYVPLLSTQWMNNLSRADVKSPELAWTDEDVGNIYERWLVHDKVRNIQKFKTRPRSKKSGRTAGGQGIALGSHKSQLRVTVYKRSGRGYHLEAQVTGHRLRGLVEEARLEWITAPRGISPDPWTTLKENIFGTGVDRTLMSAGLECETLPASIVPPGEDPNSEWEDGTVCPSRAEFDEE